MTKNSMFRLLLKKNKFYITSCIKNNQAYEIITAINKFIEYSQRSLLCHAKVVQSNASVFPDPVGNSSNAFVVLLRVQKICNLTVNIPEILHILPKGPKLNTTQQYEIYKHYKQSPTNILNDQIHYKSHTLFDKIIHSSNNNISANPTTTNRNIAASSTRTVKH